MLPVDVEAILRAFSARPIALSYKKDCYALSLLTHVIGGGRPISALRRGPFARLLEKPLVKRALARAAHGVLTPEHLRQALPDDRETFPITLSRWGGDRPRQWRSRYYQTSRPGQNLVVQLNFPASHDRAYRALLRPRSHPFVVFGHPARDDEPFTLAWARLDFDPDSGELLVEEVQSDWAKTALDYGKYAEEWLAEGNEHRLSFSRSLAASPTEFLAYLEQVFRPYAQAWHECVLTAALEFAYSELGVRRVFFHTYEGGLRMKRLYGFCQPPRSLYTDLPERFCFEVTDVAPRVLRRDRRVRKGDVRFHVLTLV